MLFFSWNIYVKTLFLKFNISPIPVMEMEKRFQETICGNEPEGKFGQKGAHERQAEKLATGYRQYRSQKLPKFSL